VNPVNEWGEVDMKLTRVGVDLAKHVFQVHGVDRAERAVWSKRLKRSRWIEEIERNAEPGAEGGMEACGGAHHWARVLQSKGYKVRLMAPQFVKPYVKSNKTDRNDAAAICEAMSRPSMRFVAVKTIEQQDIQAVHRVRASLVSERTGKANQLRGLAYEYGLVAPQEIAALRGAIPVWLEDGDNGLTMRMRALLSGLYADLRTLDERVRELDKEILAIGRENEAVGRVQELRGIGPLIASALVAMIGDARQFKNGRDVAVALGLTPRQHSSGSKERILGISKRGDSYVRTLLIHGARSALRTAPGKNDRMSRWALALAERSHANVAATALANKMARVAWAMLKHGTTYQPNGLAA
jgi:transposase